MLIIIFGYLFTHTQTRFRTQFSVNCVSLANLSKSE